MGIAAGNDEGALPPMLAKKVKGCFCGVPVRNMSVRLEQTGQQQQVEAVIRDAPDDRLNIRFQYSQTSMLEIATSAKVSKRELYALVGNKHDMLVACITERAGRMRPPADTAEPRDRESLAGVLAAFGERLLREVSDPVVVGVFRLAIAEAERAPEIAAALDSIGRAAMRQELAAVIERAQARNLLSGNSTEMAELFLALLWGDLMMRLLLRLADPPTRKKTKLLARAAASAFLRLHPS